MASCHIISMRVFEFCAHPVTRDSGSGDGDCQRWRGDGIHRSGVRKRVAAPGSSVSPLYSHFWTGPSARFAFKNRTARVQSVVCFTNIIIDCIKLYQGASTEPETEGARQRPIWMWGGRAHCHAHRDPMFCSKFIAIMRWHYCTRYYGLRPARWLTTVVVIIAIPFYYCCR